LGCLEKLDPADIARVFSSSLGETPGTWDAGRLIRAVWHDKGAVPLEYFLSFLECLETVLVQKGIRPDQFFLETIVSTNDGAMVSASTVLHFFGSFLTQLLTINMREILLDAMVQLNSYLFTGIHAEILRKTRTRDHLEYLVLSEFPSTIDKKIVAATWLKPLFQSLGTGFGFPPIEEVDVLAETYSIDEMREKGKFDDDVFAEIMSSSTRKTLYEFASDSGIIIPKHYASPDAIVVCCNRTIREETTGRTIAPEGCAYGAPFFLFRIRAKKKYPSGKLSLTPIIDGAIRGKVSTTARFGQRHNRVAALLSHVPIVNFVAGSGKLFVNDHLVCCGVPACILAAMLRESNGAGVHEFRKDDFACDGRIIRNKLDKSFNINVKRAMNHADAQMPFVTIERHLGTGKVMMTVNGEFLFKAG
jgi:hypothetical protein